MQVVELLIHKLENEPSFHRRVDLFFLVDSITQCSHNQRGMHIWKLCHRDHEAMKAIFVFFIESTMTLM